MDLPKRTNLPFLAYGLFKPGQLGFFRLREFVQSSNPDCFVQGILLERDGLPILRQNGTDRVKGDLLFFYEGDAVRAYQNIIEIEPDEHYWWGTARVVVGENKREANVLFGKSPDKGGSAPLKENDWDGKKDPLFSSALEVVQETIEQNERFEWNLKPFFRLQMAYLLLWSAIERYVSFRYRLSGTRVNDKVMRLADENIFAESLQRLVSEFREISRTDEPRKKKQLDPSDPKESLRYYYQVRSNITHRGKGAPADFDTLQQSAKELYEIFRNVLDSAFEDARRQ